MEVIRYIKQIKYTALKNKKELGGPATATIKKERIKKLYKLVIIKIKGEKIKGVLNRVKAVKIKKT